MPMSGPSTLPAILVYAILVAGFAAFVVIEIRRWRALGAFLARTQVAVRMANLVLIGLLLALMGILYFDVLPASAIRLRLAFITATPIVVLIVFVLAIWDFREIQKARLRREIEWVGQVARTIVKSGGRSEAKPSERPEREP